MATKRASKSSTPPPAARRFVATPLLSELQTFDEQPYEGLEAVFRTRCSLRTWQLVKLVGPRTTDAELEAAFRAFGDECLESWNLYYGPGEHEGEPLPANGEGMCLVPDIRIGMLLIERWLDPTTRVPAPLGVTSRGGRT